MGLFSSRKEREAKEAKLQTDCDFASSAFATAQQTAAGSADGDGGTADRLLKRTNANSGTAEEPVISGTVDQVLASLRNRNNNDADSSEKARIDKENLEKQQRENSQTASQAALLNDNNARLDTKVTPVKAEKLTAQQRAKLAAEQKVAIEAMDAVMKNKFLDQKVEASKNSNFTKNASADEIDKFTSAFKNADLYKEVKVDKVQQLTKTEKTEQDIDDLEKLSKLVQGYTNSGISSPGGSGNKGGKN